MFVGVSMDKQHKLCGNGDWYIKTCVLGPYVGGMLLRNANDLVTVYVASECLALDNCVVSPRV